MRAAPTGAALFLYIFPIMPPIPARRIVSALEHSLGVLSEETALRPHPSILLMFCHEESKCISLFQYDARGYPPSSLDVHHLLRSTDFMSAIAIGCIQVRPRFVPTIKLGDLENGI